MLRDLSEVCATLTAFFPNALSSGPVLAAAFWLREATGRDEFYAALYLYFPLVAPKPGPALDTYIEWWCKLFGTVGPG